MALRWTQTVLRTLENIAEYIAPDNPERASMFVRELRSSVHELEMFPARGKAGRVNGTRELGIHKNYRAIYRVRKGDVEILRIHHVARNFFDDDVMKKL